jgi:antitoxin component HigA of HigAB toxin-antitoxin module
MSVQIIKTPNGEEMVLLSRAEYDGLLEALAEAEEDLADIAAYDAAMADPLGSEPLPAEVSRHILKGASLLKALRLWRQLGQVELATSVDLSQGFLSDLENRKRKLTSDVAQKLATALDVPVHWLI